jgi:hypothetical protein
MVAFPAIPCEIPAAGRYLAATVNLLVAKK